MKPHVVLFWKVPMYHYNWTYTKAQIELIISDRPVSYTKSDNKGFKKPSANKVLDAVEKYNKRHNIE